jgi:hypothetical protein
VRDCVESRLATARDAVIQTRLKSPPPRRPSGALKPLQHSRAKTEKHDMRPYVERSELEHELEERPTPVVDVPAIDGPTMDGVTKKTRIDPR